MSGNKSETGTGTTIDPRLVRRRLKEGLVSPKTGIFVRIEKGPGAGRVFNLSPGGVYLIGREGADIPLDDPKVSRKHAEIGLYGPEAFVIRDLASTNGTLLNGRAVSEKAKLRHWDEIGVGETALRFSMIEETLPLSE